jgi:hypothetical protein
MRGPVLGSGVYCCVSEKPTHNRSSKPETIDSFSASASEDLRHCLKDCGATHEDHTAEPPSDLSNFTEGT